jgi:hypothetical protein
MKHPLRGKGIRDIALWKSSLSSEDAAEGDAASGWAETASGSAEDAREHGTTARNPPTKMPLRHPLKHFFNELNDDAVPIAKAITFG